MKTIEYFINNVEGKDKHVVRGLISHSTLIIEKNKGGDYLYTAHVNNVEHFNFKSPNNSEVEIRELVSKFELSEKKFKEHIKLKEEIISINNEIICRRQII